MKLKCHTHFHCRAFCPWHLVSMAALGLMAGEEDGYGLDGLWHGYMAGSWSVCDSLQRGAGTAFPTLLRYVLTSGVFYE